MVYKCFGKNSTSLTDKSVSGSGVYIPLEFNEQLVKELYKLKNKNLKKKNLFCI